METNEIVELMIKSSEFMIKSSDRSQYHGLLSKKANIMGAIGLAELYKNFADTGQTDEAMNIDSNQWVDVISILNRLSEDCLVVSALVAYNDFRAVIEINDGDTDLDIMNKFIEIAKNNSIEDVSKIKLEDITLEYIPTYITYNIKDNPNDILH
jgi:hypothetical protein